MMADGDARGALIQLNFMNVVTIIVIAAVGFYAMGTVVAFIKSQRKSAD